MPVTRAWTRQQVMASIAASDIPRTSVILVADAPNIGPWDKDFADLGFDVSVYHTGNSTPPDSHQLGNDPRRLVRMERHREMRRLTQRLVPDGPLLCIEDDGILPPDVFARLSAAGPNATGVQLGRHAKRTPGVIWPEKTEGIANVGACGHYCLLTTGETYKAAPIPEAGSVDLGHTASIRPLVVDWDCKVGHLTEDEGVLWP